MLSTNEPTALKVSETTLFMILPNPLPTFIVMPQSVSIDDRKPVLPAQGDINGLWFGFKLFGFWLFGTCMFGLGVVGVPFGGVVVGFWFTGVVVSGALVVVPGLPGWPGWSGWAGGGSINFNKFIEKFERNFQDSTVLYVIYAYVHVHCEYINSIKWR